ncbi:MAG: flippase-like domain-containing protein [Candidatus Omnitrophica bacterium]|nr:flippase-like domain-containing protein [Candidatus Omnitrophota bacterium]MCA9415002.1 flippase-like domain-containing protein [Candidatus Omnitrophota bacterium]MCB9766911.1 flippase-like domain-containing protein [Candidatus Omnitrophota bacterium]MCB9782633.1 flippase-like domain-containing protein [Candidatus Omnitrophota bacterium]
MNPSARKALKRILPIAISAVLIAVGVYYLRDSFPEIFALLSNTRFGPLLLAISSLLAATMVIAFRLKMVLFCVGIEASLFASLYYVLVATFSSSFLRITGGAAFVTGVAVSLDQKKPLQSCLVASFADRALGMLAAPLLAAAGLAFALGDTDLTRNALEYAGVCLLGVGVLLVLRFFIPGESDLRRNIWNLLRKFKIEKFAESVVFLLRSPWTLIGTIGVTAAVFLFYSLTAYLVSRALGFQVPFATFLVLIPCLSVAMLIPSVGGLGVREAVFVFFLRDRLSLEEALAVSLLYYAVSLVISGLGGIAMGMRGISRHRLEEELDRELG